MAISVYEIVTERIIKALESGTVPWRMPWKQRIPMNFVSKKPYRGINIFLLSDGVTPYWLSYKQAQSLGGQVRKGEKGSLCVFWTWLKKEEVQDNGDKKDKKIPFLRYYTVFNLSQIDGIEIPKEPEDIEFNPVENAEKIVSGYQNPPKILTKGQQACYIPSLDEIDMPKKESFLSIPEYYSTLFHEMTHSTGHEKRLNRFKDETDKEWAEGNGYSREELVAEIGASFLTAEAGIECDMTRKNSEAYIAGWLKQLRSDKKFVVMAAARAQNAVDLILNRNQKKCEGSTPNEDGELVCTCE